MSLLQEMVLLEGKSISLDTTYQGVKKSFGSSNKLDPTLSSRNVKFHLETLTKGYFDKFEETGSPFAYCGAKLHELWWEQFNGRSGNIDRVVQKLGYKSVAELVTAVQDAADTIQGNGWVVVTKDVLTAVPNHSWSAFDDVVLLIDMWEHSYQSDYKSDKKTYIKNVIENAIKWDTIEGRI